MCWYCCCCCNTAKSRIRRCVLVGPNTSENAGSACMYSIALQIVNIHNSICERLWMYPSMPPSSLAISGFIHPLFHSSGSQFKSSFSKLWTIYIHTHFFSRTCMNTFHSLLASFHKQKKKLCKNTSMNIQIALTANRFASAIISKMKRSNNNKKIDEKRVKRISNIFHIYYTPDANEIARQNNALAYVYTYTREKKQTKERKCSACVEGTG